MDVFKKHDFIGDFPRLQQVEPRQQNGHPDGAEKQGDEDAEEGSGGIFCGAK